MLSSELDTPTDDLRPYAAGSHGRVAEGARLCVLAELHDARAYLDGVIDAVRTCPDDDEHAEALVAQMIAALGRAGDHLAWFRNARECQGQA